MRPEQVSKKALTLGWCGRAKMNKATRHNPLASKVSRGIFVCQGSGLIPINPFVTIVLRNTQMFANTLYNVSATLYNNTNNKSLRKVIMAHELEINELTGEASFASLRQPAWHNLGTVFDEEVSTAQMLKLAHLDEWNVRLEDVAIPDGFASDKTYSFVSRTNPFDKTQTDILGVVGERYKVLQNEDLFSFGDNLLDGGGRWETAGSIKGGRQVFGSIALSNSITLDPKGIADKIDNYLLINTSHDGSVAIQASITPVRVVCANTLNLALSSFKGKNASKQSFKIRHTQTAEGKIAVAREALGLATKYIDEFSVMANAMIEKTITDNQFLEIINLAYPAPENDAKGSFKKHDNKVDLIQSIYRGQYNDTIAGTAWGAYNALTERLDWYRSARGESNESIYASASGFDPVVNAEKNRLMKLVQGVVMA
jgi:phage/plasmid-like protein (TIGR03299 family)